MTLHRRKVIGILGSGNQEYPELAIPLGQWLAKHNYHLLTGGGAGVMKVTAQAFCQTVPRRGISLGIIPTKQNSQGQFIPLDGYPNPWVELAITSPLSRFDTKKPKIVSRNYICVMSSNLLVALPGKEGTRNEVELALRFHKPLILLGSQEQLQEFPSSVPRATTVAQVTNFIANHFKVN